MAGTRPVVELMYMDFALMASDQIANQAAKWHYMSGRPGRGAARDPRIGRCGQGLRRPALASHSRDFTHTPGLYVVYPSNPGGCARGCSSRRSGRTTRVMFVESQGLYRRRGRPGR